MADGTTLHPLAQMSEEEFGDYKARAATERFDPGQQAAPPADITAPPTQQAPAPADPAPAAPAPELVPPHPGNVAPSDAYIIPRGNAYQELVRLLNEDDGFRNTVSTAVGRRLERKYKPEISRLSAENESLRKRLERTEFQQELAKLRPEEVDRRFAADPQFAEKYTKMVHAKDEPATDTSAIEEESYLESQAEDWYEQGALAGIPQARLEQFRAAWKGCPRCQTTAHSFYVHADDGSVLDVKTPALLRRAMQDRFITVLNREIRAVEAAKANAAAAARNSAVTDPAPAAAPTPGQDVAAAITSPAAPAAPSPAATSPAQDNAAPANTPPYTPVNPNLLRMTPDASNPQGRPATGMFKFTRADVRAMDPEERIRNFPNPGDYERAILNGEVEPPEGFDSNFYRQASAS